MRDRIPGVVDTPFTNAVPKRAAVHNDRVKLASAAEIIETRLSANSEDAKRNAEPVGSTKRHDLDDASKMHAFSAHLESLGRPWRSWYLLRVVCETEAVRSLSSTDNPARRRRSSLLHVTVAVASRCEAHCTPRRRHRSNTGPVTLGQSEETLRLGAPALLLVPQRSH